MELKIFGPNWRCPSPVVLHIGNPEHTSTGKSNTICPVWKKSNELFSKVLSYHSTTGASSLRALGSDHAEAGLLYLGIKKGWDTVSNSWIQSPVLNILKQIDDLLFCHLPNKERLAVAYKSFKLLKVRLFGWGEKWNRSADSSKYYLNATRDGLDRLPTWLRPRYHHKPSPMIDQLPNELAAPLKPPPNTLSQSTSSPGPPSATASCKTTRLFSGPGTSRSVTHNTCASTGLLP